MELVIVLACGVFFLGTAVFAYVRQIKDFKKSAKKSGEKK